MEKTEAKELIKAINALAKAQNSCNKELERLSRLVNDTNDINKEIATRLLTLSNSIDNIKIPQTKS